MYRLLERRQHFRMYFNIIIWCYIKTKWFSYSKNSTHFPKCNFIFDNCNASLQCLQLSASFQSFDSRYNCTDIATYTVTLSYFKRPIQDLCYGQIQMCYY